MYIELKKVIKKKKDSCYSTIKSILLDPMDVSLSWSLITMTMMTMTKITTMTWL